MVNLRISHLNFKFVYLNFDYYEFKKIWMKWLKGHYYGTECFYNKVCCRPVYSIWFLGGKAHK